MKTPKIFLTALFVVFYTVTFAQVKVSDASSPHNFLAESWTTEICNVCHTPHNAVTTLLPLWSHATSAETFTYYWSPTLDGDFIDSSGATVTAASGATGSIGGASGLCLGCHDGTSFLDDFHNGPGSPSVTIGSVDGNFGTDLTDDHPISIIYVDGGTTQMIDSESVAPGYLFPTATANVVTVECASCHSLHRPVTGTTLLRVDNSASALCLDCHDK